jgi:antitoxin PrlF
MGAKSRVTSKGQVTIPKEVREELGLRVGDEVEFVKDESGVRIRKDVPEAAFEKYRGYLKHLKGRDVDELIREMRGDDLRD